MLNSYTIIIETNRLMIRRQVIEDLEYLWALYRDPDIIKFIPDAPRSREEAKEELEWHMNGHPKHPELGLWATIHKETGKFIGRCGLLPWQIDGTLEIEVAYLLDQEFRGRGLATEATKGILDYGFEKLNLTRLICLIDPENIASQHVAERIGMILDRRVDGIGGDNIPTLIYSISR